MEYYANYNQEWPIDELTAISIAASFGEESYVHEPLMSPHDQPMICLKRPAEFDDQRPFKNPKTNSHVVMNSQNYHLKPKEEEKTSPIMSSSSTITFAADHHLVSQPNQHNYMFKPNKSVTANGKLTQAQDHIIAERKRREKLTQRFIALSALIPGLKKMDKASVLGDAIKHLKQLQERVKTLEEQTKKKPVESVVFVKKYELYGDADNSSTDENYSTGAHEPLPEIEARISEKDVLIRIHCEKRKGIVDKTVSEIEKLHLTVINTCALSFGTSALDMTIIAQMDEEFAMTVQDLVKNLRSALKKFM